jgi:hypothetical protein
MVPNKKAIREIKRYYWEEVFDSAVGMEVCIVV